MLSPDSRVVPPPPTTGLAALLLLMLLLLIPSAIDPSDFTDELKDGFELVTENPV